MPWFSKSYTLFFKELSANNTSEWFDENRKTYENEVKKPFKSFVEEMIARIAKLDPEVQIGPSDAISRINRDTRFSKDKTPYNIHMSANISRLGKKSKEDPGFFFQLSADGIKLYGGAYVLEPASLQKIRAHIAANLKEFASLCNAKDFREKYGELQGEKSKKLPPAFQPLLEKEPLIANKQFYYTASLKPALLTSDELPDSLMDYYKAGRKMNAFLANALRN